MLLKDTTTTRVASQCILVLLSIVFFVGCEPEVPCEELPAGNLPVTLQLNWIADPTFTGEYLARELDYWQQNGLEVTIQTGGGGIDPIAHLISGKADFAVVGADKAVIARSSGTPLKVVSVDFQRNPVGWIVRRNLDVHSFHEIVDADSVVLGDKVGTETTAILKVALKRLGLDDEAKPQGVGFDFAYFVQHSNLAYPVYLNEEPVRAEQAGIDIVEVHPSAPKNGGVQLYGNVLITTEQIARECPRTVEAFSEGLRRGWNFATSERDSALTRLRAVEGLQEYPALEPVFDRTLEFVTTTYSGETVPPGHMETSMWERTLDVIKETGEMTDTVRVSEFVVFR